MSRQFVPGTDKIYQEDIPKADFFKALYERSNKQLLW